MTTTRKNQRPTGKTQSGVISKEELEKKGGVIPSGRGHWVRLLMLAMKKDELLFVDKRDWNWKSAGNTPARIVRALNKKGGHHYTISLVGDQSGWVIERDE